MEYVIGYLIIVNALGFLLMHIDKQKARRRKRRIPEKVLLGTAIAGGSIGVYAGMKTFRHKTRHRIFKWGVPGIIAIQVLLLTVILCSGTPEP